MGYGHALLCEVEALIDVNAALRAHAIPREKLRTPAMVSSDSVGAPRILMAIMHSTRPRRRVHPRAFVDLTHTQPLLVYTETHTAG
eukprot:3935366-Rhodomonas_salina.6